MLRLVLPGLLLGCTTASSKPGDSGGDSGSGSGDTGAVSYIEGRECPSDSYLTWESFGEGFMLDHCTGCHSALLEEGQRAGAPLGVDFNTQALVQDQLDRIYARSADDNTTMPPTDTVDTWERAALGEWLACGAP